MALMHMAVKTVSRATGRSAVAASAYRSGELLTNERDGVTHDYRARQGVEHTEIVTPVGAEWAQDRAALWNAAEAAEKRQDSRVAREWEVALPAELSPEQRRALAVEFATGLVERFGVAADVAIHAPHRDGDERNHHAHILTTTRVVTPDGLGGKTRELDRGDLAEPEIARMRERWAEMQNRGLDLAEVAERVDHRSYAEQGVEIEPTGHVGVHATGMERKAEHEAERTGQVYEPVTERGQENAAVMARRSLATRIREEIAALATELRELAEQAREVARRVGEEVRAGVEAVAGKVLPRKQPEDEVARWMAEQATEKDDEWAKIEAALASGAASGDGLPARSVGIAETIAESQRETAAEARREAERAVEAQRAAQAQRETLEVAQRVERTPQEQEQYRGPSMGR